MHYSLLKIMWMHWQEYNRFPDWNEFHLSHCSP
jgi:hypothetical protein